METSRQNFPKSSQAMYFPTIDLNDTSIWRSVRLLEERFAHKISIGELAAQAGVMELSRMTPCQLSPIEQ